MAANVTDDSSNYFSCAEWNHNFKNDYTKTLKTSYLWNCILTVVLAIHATILNSLIVVLYFKVKRLQTTANVLILALAFTDLFVALVNQPAVVVNNALRFHEIHSCLSELLSFILTEIGVGLSCVTVCFTITFERLFAICSPLKHRVFVTKSRLKKLFLAQVILQCATVLPFTLNSSLTSLMIIQSRSIFFAISFMLAAYLCMFVIIHKRARPTAKNGVATDFLEKGSPNFKPKKISTGKNVSHSSRRVDKSTNNASQYSKRANKCTNNVSQDSKEANKRTDNVSQATTRADKPKDNVSQDSKEKSNSPKYRTQDSMSRNERILDENLSLQNLHPNSVEIMSHDSNDIEIKIPDDKLKIPDDKLKDEQRTCKTCALLQKAILKLKQERRVCKTMSMIAGTLALCFLPRAVIFKCALSGAISKETFYNYFEPWLELMCFLNSSLNPYIYFFYNKDVKEGVKKVIFGKRMKQSVYSPG